MGGAVSESGDARQEADGDGKAHLGAGVAWVPGTSYRPLADGTVGRFVTNEGVLLDYAVRLEGAVREIRAVLADDVLGDGRVDAAEAVFDRWGV